jgi:hypothetical protein
MRYHDGWREDDVVPGGNGCDDADASICADAGTGRAVMEAAKHRGLASVPGFPFEVRTSASTLEQAGRLADRCARAYRYLGDMLAFHPQCALVVLNRADWSERASSHSTRVTPSSYSTPSNGGSAALVGRITSWVHPMS